jgi:hypothetical protein
MSPTFLQQNAARVRIQIARGKPGGTGLLSLPGRVQPKKRNDSARSSSRCVADLWAHKLRAFLTMFGIAWGIVSIVLMVAAGEGCAKGRKSNQKRWART